MVADRGLLEREQVFEVADADRLAAGLEQAVEDLDAVAVGERLEHPLELAGLVLGQAGLGDRGAALHERESGHALHHIEEILICWRHIEIPRCRSRERLT